MQRDGAPRILLVEDDAAVREAVLSALESEGYRVTAVADGLAVPSPSRTAELDLAILDVRLGDGPDGLAVGRAIRASTDLPVIYLTAADTVEDRLAGFEAGADDYVVKPFSMAELLHRVRVVLRRTGAAERQVLRFEDLEVDPEGRTATRAGEELALTRTEFDLLATLLANAGRVVSKTQLLTSVWDFDAYDPNLVEVHLSSLRRKLEQHGPRIVQTVRGLGYVVRR